MIGQIDLFNNLSDLLADNELPRFCIIEGAKGSGRKTLIRELIENPVFVEDVKVDTIRNIIAEAYRQRVETFYIIPDADKMSLAAQNALLKVTEEPPNKAYFIMTLEDRQNTLKTIISRATVFTMDRYTEEELVDYLFDNYNVEATDLIDLCDVPGDVDLLYSIDTQEFIKFVQIVYENIAEVTVANALKTSARISFKEDDGKDFDLKMFWKTFMSDCIDHRNAVWALITSQCLRINGINKQMLFDKWIMMLRRNSNG